MRLLATLKVTKEPVVIVDFVWDSGFGLPQAVYLHGNYLHFAPLECFEAVTEVKEK